jgi:hypothetical protein
VVFASKVTHFEPQWKWLLAQAKRLEGLFGLKFSTYVQRLKQCYELDVG